MIPFLSSALLLCLAGGAPTQDVPPPPAAPAAARAAPEAPGPPLDLRVLLARREQVLTEALRLDRGQRRDLSQLLSLELDRALAAERMRRGGGPGMAEPTRRVPARTGKVRLRAPGGKAGRKTSGGASPDPGAGPREAPAPPPGFAVLSGADVHPALKGLRFTTVSALLRLLRPDQVPIFGRLVGAAGMQTLRQLAAARRLLSPRLPGRAGGRAGKGRGAGGGKGRGGKKRGGGRLF